MWRTHFRKNAWLAFDDAQCVMGANWTMQRLKHIVRATMPTIESLPVMCISLFELMFEVTFRDEASVMALPYV